MVRQPLQARGACLHERDGHLQELPAVQAGGPAHQGHEVGHGDVEVAKDVQGARPPLLCGQHMATGHVPDIDDVDAAVEVGPAQALQDVHDDLSRGSWCDVHGPEGEARVHDHQVEPVLREAQCLLL